jgi:hypothetical protein
MKQAAHLEMIGTLHGQAPFGSVLDAGTGPRSIRWLLAQESESWTAVTGDPIMRDKVGRLAGDKKRPEDRLVLGNWSDPGLLAGERFDTVIADHLLGAIEGFAPFFQTSLFARLRALTAKRLYVTGMQPYVTDRPTEKAGAIIWRIGRYRDACLLLLGRNPFREFPLDWVLAELRRSGFEPSATREIQVGYKEPFVNGQIDLVRPGLEKLKDRALGDALLARGEALRARALAYLDRHGSLQHGFSYVIAAEPA